jgi:hypothetical protein
MAICVMGREQRVLQLIQQKEVATRATPFGMICSSTNPLIASMDFAKQDEILPSLSSARFDFNRRR